MGFTVNIQYNKLPISKYTNSLDISCAVDTTSESITPSATSKNNRYFSRPETTNDIECDDPALKPRVHNDKSTSATVSSNNGDTSSDQREKQKQKQRQRQRQRWIGVEACLAHCHRLWASCQVEVVCDYIYRCLQVESDLLPFCSPQTNHDSFLPPELQDFACDVREQREVNALYACLLYMLVTGDFLNPHLFEERGDRDCEDDSHSHVNANICLLSSPR